MADSMPAAADAQHSTPHHPIVPTAAGLAPYCTCGWPETEGGQKMVWRYGDKLLADHLAEVRQ